MMNTRASTFRSTRTFVVFSYSDDRGLLLLRSRKANDHPTRIDVLIQYVRAMKMRLCFTGIEIDEVGPEYLRDFRSNPAEMIEPGNKVYSLRGNGWQGLS